jgi:hypothetical protein
MNKSSAVSALLFLASLMPSASAKDKPTITIEVVDSQTWQRDVAIHHSGYAQTNCNTNGSTNGTVSDSGNVYATTSDTTNCSTTSSPAYTTHREITQESIHAILNGQHVLLWCQNGFRKCSALQPGTYQAEPDGKNAVKIYVYSLVTHEEIGKLKYRVAGTW